MKIKEKKETGVICNIELKTFNIKSVCYWTVVTIAIISALVMIFPIIWMYLSSFKDTREFLQKPVTLLPRSIDLGKILHVWKDTGIGRTFYSTILMTMGSVVVTLLIAGLAGYGMSKLKPKGSGIFQKMIFMMLLMPGSMSLVPVFKLFTNVPILNISLLDTYWPIWIMAGWCPFYYLLVKSFFDGIDMAFVEAARIDGATNLQIFYKIMLPLSLPVFATIGIFTFNAQWGQFFWPYLTISDDALMPIGLRLYLMESQLPIDEYLMALGISVAPVLLIFIIFQDNIMKGMSIGGLKG